MATVLQLSGMLPRDPQFREFLGYFMVPPREMSIDTAAVDRFHKYIRKPFLLWRERQEEHA